MNFETGARIGAYKLVQYCGGGAYGEVFVAENTLTGTRAALKRLFPSPKTAKRELAGLIRWRNCRHPNLLRIWHVERTPDAFYYTMDLADDLNAGRGEYLPDTLANRLEKSGPLSAAEVEKLAAALAEALKFMHDRGLVHRDVKPDNILWIDGVPTLGDPGLTAETQAGSLVGTPEFMPPEVLRKKRPATADDDFYALRLVLYCALTGEAPGSYPHCPENLAEVENSALWRRILDPAATPEKAVGPRRGRVSGFAVGTAVLLAAAVSLAALFIHRRHSEPPRTELRNSAPEHGFMLERELPKLLAQYEKDDAEYRYFRQGAEAHSRKFYEDLNALRDKLRFQKAFGHLNDAEYAAAEKALCRQAAAGMEHDVFLRLYECQLRLDEHLKRSVMYPIHAAGDLAEKAERDFCAEARKMLEERRALLKRLRAEPELVGTFALPHSLWNFADEIKKEAPHHHWGVAAENAKIKAFYDLHRAELRKTAAALPEGGAPEKLKKTLGALTEKCADEEKLLRSVCLLHTKYIDCPAWAEQRIGRTPENIRFYAALFRLNRDLVGRLYREYPQYRR